MGNITKEENIKKLDLVFKEQKYCIKNLSIPLKGQNVLLDYVVVHKTGIYIIKIEELSGSIKGNEKDKTWVQSIGRKTNDIPNIYKAVSSALKELLNIVPEVSKSKYKAFVSFPKGANIDEIDAASSQICMQKESALAREIKKEILEKKEVLDEETVAKIFRYIKSYSNLTKQEKIDYLDKISVKNAVYNPEELAKNYINSEKKAEHKTDLKVYLNNVREFSTNEKKSKIEELNKQSFEYLQYALIIMLVVFTLLLLIVISAGISFLSLIAVIGIISIVFASAFIFLSNNIKDKIIDIEDIKLVGICPCCGATQHIRHRKIFYSCLECGKIYYINEKN